MNGENRIEYFKLLILEDLSRIKLNLSHDNISRYM